MIILAVAGPGAVILAGLGIGGLSLGFLAYAIKVSGG